MTEYNSAGGDPRKQLQTLRIIWGALIAGQVIFFLVATLVRQQSAGAAPDAPLDVLMMVATAMSLAAIPTAFILRRATFGPAPVAPQKYATGTIIALALLEGPSLFGLVIYLLGGPTYILAIPAVMIAAQAVSFPTGAPMAAGKDAFRI